MNFSMEEVHVNTQPATQLDEETNEFDTNMCGEDEEIVWARLLPMSAVASVQDLVSLGGGQEKGRRKDMHIIGRNSKCHIVLNDSRISGFHCRIYRQVANPGGLHRFVTYVEDMSSNGTFVNKVRLIKHEPRQLMNGDEVALVSPKKDAEGNATYIFILNALQKKDTIEFSSQSLPDSVHGGRTHKNVLNDSGHTKEKKRCVQFDYDLREELGSGAIGKVYRAIDRISGQGWAIKIVSLGKATMPDDSSHDLMREAKILSELIHPAIVSIRDLYCNNHTLAIVMQLVDGGDLFDRIVQRTTYPENDARDLLSNLLPALTYLHEKGIAHRDIKPENILLRSKQSHVDVLLTDFGLAKFAAVGSHACTTFCGTPQYIAPEVLDQQKNDGSFYDGAAADIWSVGVVLFLLLSGSQPARSEWLFDHIRWNHISIEAKNAVSFMTVVNPTHRPSATTILKMPWFSMGAS